MREFMLLIRNLAEVKENMPADRHTALMNDCKVYIEELQQAGTLISAQPLVREGLMLAGASGSFKTSTYAESPEVIVGYYHVRAANLDDAVAIASRNPEFAYSDTARIEVRPVKMKEEKTGYNYPGKA